MFWSSQMLSFAEFCAGSRVSMATPFAILRVSTSLLAAGAEAAGALDEASPPPQAVRTRAAAATPARSAWRPRRRGLGRVGRSRPAGGSTDVVRSGRVVMAFLREV